MPSTEYHLRLHVPSMVDAGCLEKLLKDKCTEYTVGYEVPEDNPSNPHYQGYIVTDYADVTMRKEIVKLLKIKGNRAYSLTKLRKSKEELLQYVCKDCDVKYTTLTDEQVELYMSIGKARKEELKKKKEKKKTPSLLERLMSDIRVSTAENYEQLLKAILMWYAEAGKVIPCDLMLKQMLVTIRLKQYMQSDDPHRVETALNNYCKRVLGNVYSPDLCI